MVQDGSLKELGDRLAAKEAEDMQRINQVAQIFRSEILEIRDEMIAWRPSIEQNMTDLHLSMTSVRDQMKHYENAIATFLGAGGAGGPPGIGGGFGSPGFAPQERRAKGLEIRVPDPMNWALDVLQNGDKVWYAWRKSFELQVRSVWGDLDKLLFEMRDHEEPMDEKEYVKLLEEMHIIPEGGNPVDYGDKHVSNKLYINLALVRGRRRAEGD